MEGEVLGWSSRIALRVFDDRNIIAAVTSRESGLAIPGSIIAGIGGILYYQNATNDWESWAYAWTLIIGFVGVGTFIMHMLDGRVKRAFNEGFNSIVSSLVMFLTDAGQVS